MVDGGRAGARLAPAIAAGAVAATAAAVIAVHLAPRPDELHTLAHVDDPSLGALWRSYRGAIDATPPAQYVLSWSAARVLGSGLVAVRVPFVACWAATAALLALAARRAGPVAAFAAGVVPSATALVYLGAYARPYSPALAALALAVLAWDRLGAATGRARSVWAVTLGAAVATAVAIHYASAVAALVLAAVGALTDRSPRRAARWVAPVVGAAVALAASVPVLGQAGDAQGAMAATVRPLDAAAFWPSAVSPALVALVPAALLTAWLAIDRRRGPTRAGAVLSPGSEALGWSLAAIVPVGVVAAMAVTSGIYFHRYPHAALLGAGLVVAASIGGGDARRRRWSGLVAVLLVGAVVLATLDVTRSSVGRADAAGLLRALDLDAGGATVLVVDEYDFALLRYVAPAAVDVRLRLGAAADGSSPPPGLVTSPARADVQAVLDGLDAGESVDLLGAPGELEPFVAGFEGRVREVASASYARPGLDRELVHLRFTAR